ncbi:MAG: GatB/YqeY domain-containing protein [Pseudomonadales bacterium]|nr:GatB/YqeY domain-containing protein [Pseudomonadales bacterium]
MTDLAVSTLKASVNDALKLAMKAHDKLKTDTLRMLNAAFKQIEVDERIVLDNARCLAILEKQIKQRRESLAAYEQAGRTDLADREQQELAILSAFLPEPLAEEELSRLIETAIAETGATSARDMGRVMNILRPLLTGRADMSSVSAKVKARLG